MRGAGYRANPLQLSCLACCLCLATAVAASAAAAAASSGSGIKSPQTAHSPRISLPPTSRKRFFGVMDCAERCESFNIKVFKAYWAMNHSNKSFIQYLRDLVVYTAIYKNEMSSFKQVLDKAVRDYEFCRYATCGTDYLMG